jgi:hypothetical protein
MAQQTRSRSSARGRSSTRSSSAGSTRSSSARGRSTARSPKNKGAVDAAKDATVKSASTAGNAVSSAAKKFKTPVIAAGAGVAGVAGGIALARRKDKKILGVSLPNRGTAQVTSKNVASAARNLGAFAERTGRIAEQVRAASEAVGEDGARRKSPIEVVLDGLTRRSASR